MQGSNDTTHRLSRRTATTRFSPERIGCQKQTAPMFCQHLIRWVFTSQAFTIWRHLSTHPINRLATRLSTPEAWKAELVYYSLMNWWQNWQILSQQLELSLAFYLGLFTQPANVLSQLQTTDGRTTTYSEHEHEFTFDKNRRRCDL